MKIKKIKWNFETNLPLKGDREFCIKTIKYGHGVLKFNKYFFNTQGIGTGIGGLQKIYDQNKDIDAVKKIFQTYPQYVEPFINNMRRNDFKFDFVKFCEHYKKICK
jgi:hypothetical protein